jgi:nucleoside-diphosphate-sugar epimerase
LKTLITGATGFIGRHLVRRLVKEGESVTCLVRETSDTKSLEKLGVELAYGDLLNKDSLKRVLGDENIRVVFHLAGAVYSRVSRNYHKINALGTENLLSVCNVDKIKKFILVSSITAVGPQRHKNIILDENTVPNPIPPYGRSKYDAEQIALKYYEKHNLPVVIVRPPLVYGPEQGRDITDFFKKIESGFFRIIGDGECVTSLCYIDNLVDGLLLVVKKEDSAGRIYFIADKKIYTFKQISETIAKELGVGLSALKIPPLIADISGFLYAVLNNIFGMTSVFLYTLKLMTLNFACDISRAHRELSYRPTVNFEEGIKRTVKWYKEEFKGS